MAARTFKGWLNFRQLKTIAAAQKKGGGQGFCGKVVKGLLSASRFARYEFAGSLDQIQFSRGMVPCQNNSRTQASGSLVAGLVAVSRPGRCLPPMLPA